MFPLIKIKLTLNKQFMKSPDSCLESSHLASCTLNHGITSQNIANVVPGELEVAPVLSERTVQTTGKDSTHWLLSTSEA